MKVNSLLRLLICVLFIFPTLLYAQDYNINSDTLKLNKKNLKDSLAISNFIDFIFDNKNQNPINSLNLIDFAINRSNEIKKIWVQAKAINVKGAIYDSMADHSNALKYYIQALKFFEKTTHYYSNAIATNNVG